MPCRLLVGLLSSACALSAALSIRCDFLCTEDFTQHAAGDGESEGGPSGHPPAGRKVGQLRSQHLHNHLIIQSQVEMVLVEELWDKREQGVNQEKS